MTKISTKNNPQLAQNSADAIEQLSSIFSAYNETTNRLHQSYQQLKDEVERLRRELKQKNEQLERKNRLAALGEMAAGMAHEIRNPLGGIQLYASLLERELQGREDSLQWVRKISKGVQSLDAIVSDMLAFTADQICDKNGINLADLVCEVMDYVKPRIESCAVKIDHDNIAGDLMVNADDNMMKRVFLNLILNAVDAVAKNGRIAVTAERESAHPDFKLRICVSDTGPGIKPELMNKIFNPFFTTKDTGTGLGLAIVHRLVECQGGIITAANNEEGGAIFTIMLP